ncbi:hypothetical protein A2U01_0107427, partial [Trifolium medium]|nr:hypothetical protein [Trifolium medium]
MGVDAEPSSGYSVNGAYYLLTHLEPVEMSTHCGLIWNKLITLRVYLFAWRLMGD